MAGKTFKLGRGQRLTVGRTARADVVIPQDTFLSSIHFSLECNGATCRVVDRKSANGTLLNRVRVTEGVVRDGDEITAGRTPFVVHIAQPAEAPASAPEVGPLASAVTPTPRRAAVVAGRAAVSVGSWHFSSIPKGWALVEGYGLRRSGSATPPAEIVAGEDQPLTTSLADYIQTQLGMLPLLVLDAQARVTGPVTIPGAEEAIAVAVTYKVDDGRSYGQRQFYARAGRSVGVLTMTGPAEEFPLLLPALESVLAGIRFGSAPS